MLNKNRKVSVLAACVWLCLTLQRKQLKREKIDQGPYTWWWEQVVRRGLPTVDRRREGVRWGPDTTCKGTLPTFRITPLSESKLPIGGPMGTFHIQTTTRKTQKPTSQEKGGGAAVIFFLSSISWSKIYSKQISIRIHRVSLQSNLFWSWSKFWRSKN